MTNAAIGYGSKLEISQDSGANWDEIAEVTNITPPSSTRDLIDATHMQSPNSDREFILGLNDPGECSFEINYLPGSTSDSLLLTLKASSAAVKVRMTFPNGAVLTFDGLLQSYEASVPTDDKMTASVSFKVTGSPVLTHSAAPSNTLLPAISGLAKVGQALTAIVGQWTAAVTFAYQWKANGVDIAGATSKTYVPVVGDVGDAITVVVTATNSTGSTSATSAATAAVVS